MNLNTPNAKTEPCTPMLLLQGLHCMLHHLRSITVVQGPQWGMLGVLSAIRVENETPPPKLHVQGVVE